MNSSSAAAGAAASADANGAGPATFSLPTFHCPAHIQLHPYNESHTLRKLSIQRIQSDPFVSSSSSSSSTPPQLQQCYSVRLLGLLQSSPAPAIQTRTSQGTKNTAVITFHLADDTGTIVVDCPLSILFAHLSSASKQEWMSKQQQKTVGEDADSISNQQFNSFVIGLLSSSSSVVEVCGTVDHVPQDPTCTTTIGIPRLLVASAIRWISTPTPQRAQQLLQTQAAEREALSREHYFRTTPLPSSHPPKMQLPKKTPQMMTPSRPPLPTNAAHTPLTNTTKQNTPHTVDDRRARIAPMHTPAPVAASSAAAASPLLPLPLPFSLSQSSQPTTSLFDDFASSQEERAHFALADQAAQQFVQIQQQQQLQPRTPQAPTVMHQPYTPAARQPVSRQSIPSTKATHPPLHPPTGSPVGLNRAALPPAMPSPASSVVSNKPTFKAPRPLAASAKSSNATNSSHSYPHAIPESALNVPSSSGFQTGSGKSDAMSAAAMERAAKLQRQWEAEEEAERVQTSGGALETNPPDSSSANLAASSSEFSLPPAETSDQAPPAGFALGFATGSGKKVEVSDAARKRAEKMMAEIEAECEANQDIPKVDTVPAKLSASNEPPVRSVASDVVFRAPSTKPFRPPASTRPPPAHATTRATVSTAPRDVADAIQSNKLSKLEMLELEIAQMEGAGDAIDLDENLALQLKPTHPIAPIEKNQNSMDSYQSTTLPMEVDRATLSTSPPPTDGFLSGGGKSLALSAAAKERAQKLQRQWEQEEEQAEHKTAPTSSPHLSSPMLDFQVASRRCRVVKLQRKKSGEIVQNCDVYIGREENRGGWALARSKWCNPFQTVAEFETYLMGRSDLLAALPELKGKTLGCWCKVTPASPCHGDVLVKLVNALEKQGTTSSQSQVTNRPNQVENHKSTLTSSAGFQSASSTGKGNPMMKAAAETRLSKFQLELMKELEMDNEGSDNIIDFATSSSALVEENGFGSAGSLSQTAVAFSSGFAAAAKISTDTLILPSSSLSGEKRKLSQIPEENTQELLNAATSSLARSVASNADKLVSPSPVTSLPALATPLFLAPRVAPPTTVHTISSSTFSVDSTSSPPIKRTRYEPNTITTVNQSPAPITSPVAAPPPTPIPIASFDAASPATPPRDSSVLVVSGTPVSSEKLSNSQIRIPATPSLETPPHSLEMEFDAAASQHQQESVRKDASLANQPSSCLPIDSYLPPSFFLTPPLSNLASEVTTFASQL